MSSELRLRGTSGPDVKNAVDSIPAYVRGPRWQHLGGGDPGSGATDRNPLFENHLLIEEHHLECPLGRDQMSMMSSHMRLDKTTTHTWEVDGDGAPEVDAADIFIVLCPPMEHMDRKEMCDYETWGHRGWCRVELAAAALSRHPQRQGPQVLPVPL